MRDSRPSVWDYLTKRDLKDDKDAIKNSFASHVEYSAAKDEYTVTDLDFFQSLALSVRDRMVDRWNKTQQSYYEQGVKRVYYLSMEFLIGRLLQDGLNSLGIADESREALSELKIDFEEVIRQEPDAGLGNGGLGRLAACFLDSMATLEIPAMGYGIRYEYGLFRQTIQDGRQVEIPDNWLRFGWPWEIPRVESVFTVQFGGRVERVERRRGGLGYRLVDTENVKAMAYDILVPGYRNDVVNTLRLWGAKASRAFDFANFNRGDYFAAVADKNESENISRVLYPNDTFFKGRALRLKQEHFFVSATLQDAIRRHLKEYDSITSLPDHAVFQLNDTHPSLAVAELMRLLLDDFELDWDEAWQVTSRSFAYTNHTILPEALEKWRVVLFEQLLPRHLQIIYEINRRFLEDVARRFPGDTDRLGRVSLVEEVGDKRIKMAHLAIVGSRSINGVSALHSGIVRTRLFKDFYDLYPERFNNKTNGITPRRWLLGCNPALARLITSRIGDGWIRDLNRLKALEEHCDDKAFQAAWQEVKQDNKERLARTVLQRTGELIDPGSLFDVQVKRIHEYKRQLLNVLHALRLYRDIKYGRGEERTPRTVLIAGKAAPGYERAKLIVRLVNAVGNWVNRDPDVKDRLKVVFVPDYSVSLAERIIPAADLSEQISTAGMEASGTGNMKLSLNGALTIGTLDGANIEIGDAVGGDNIFIFGKKAHEVDEIKQRGYRPRELFDRDQEVRDIVHLIASGDLLPEDPTAFWPLVDALLERDDYLVLTDFASYCDVQTRVDALYRDPAAWTRKSILNTAAMGRFSSDRTITEYARDIWGVMS
jgi:glycogen phosphorylase